MNKIKVIGAGLAGCEAAYQLAIRGFEVELHEMKPQKMSPVHHSVNFAELVCSNSLRGADIANAVGLMKEEMRRLGSLIIEVADETAVEAGGALAVDRELFSQTITDRIKNHPNITVIDGEVCDFSADEPIIIASGPLTSDDLFASIKKFLGDDDYLHFYDAAAPIVSFESVDMESAYFKSRYDKGTPDYINCPMNKEEYELFWNEICTAQEAEVHGFEDMKVFEGCMPVEVMARRGEQTLLFGPLKPVGLRDPKTGRDPYAVVQLRKDNKQGSMYNIVGFQTHLKFPEQKRVFSLIPALKNAEFLRYGVMHRNTFIDSPKNLDKFYRARKNPNVYFAGQITGVEGYVESASSGFMAGVNLARSLRGMDLIEFSNHTALGAMSLYISNESVEKFQPMNINFGIIEPLGYRIKGKKEKNTAIAMRGLEEIDRLTDAFKE
ncbi:MAG: methylenetetrahydrofolate--tRNA-(uracil(54)-C(5))-methyltransferase (FADH(2)-oxidizing) TrmFO [Clostridia bacterium]